MNYLKLEEAKVTRQSASPRLRSEVLVLIILVLKTVFRLRSKILTLMFIVLILVTLLILTHGLRLKILIRVILIRCPCAFRQGFGSDSRP